MEGVFAALNRKYNPMLIANNYGRSRKDYSNNTNADEWKTAQLCAT
jgi:hypothetical protein